MTGGGAIESRLSLDRRSGLIQVDPFPLAARPSLALLSPALCLERIGVDLSAFQQPFRAKIALQLFTTSSRGYNKGDYYLEQSQVSSKAHSRFKSCNRSRFFRRRAWRSDSPGRRGARALRCSFTPVDCLRKCPIDSPVSLYLSLFFLLSLSLFLLTCMRFIKRTRVLLHSAAELAAIEHSSTPRVRDSLATTQQRLLVSRLEGPSLHSRSRTASAHHVTIARSRERVERTRVAIRPRWRAAAFNVVVLAIEAAHTPRTSRRSAIAGEDLLSSDPTEHHLRRSLSTSSLLSLGPPIKSPPLSSPAVSECSSASPLLRPSSLSPF